MVDLGSLSLYSVLYGREVYPYVCMYLSNKDRSLAGTKSVTDTKTSNLPVSEIWHDMR